MTDRACRANWASKTATRTGCLTNVLYLWNLSQLTCIESERFMFILKETSQSRLRWFLFLGNKLCSETK